MRENQVLAEGFLTNVTKPFVPDPENGNQMTAPKWDFEYDPYGRLLDTRDPKGRITTNAYDFAGRPVEFRLPMGQIATNQYDSFGRLWKKYDFKGQLEQLSYDSLGRVQSREFYTNNASQLAKRICISYDELGRQKKIVELTGNALGNSCATVLASLKNTGWPGMFAMLMPMLGLIALPRYSLRDSLRRLRLFLRHPILSVCHSERSEESLSCGWRGWQIERLRAMRAYRPMSRWWRFVSFLLIPFMLVAVLDIDSRVFASFTCADRSDPNIRITEFTYDADNHITQICSPEGAVNYEYDTATGRHTRTWTTNNDTRYSYDELGRLKTVEVYKRNGVTLTTPEVTTYTYTAVGSRESVTLPNGTRTTYTYDSLNRLKKLENRNTSNVLLSSYEYTLHETGRRIGATEIILQEDDASYRTNVISWAYDGMYRLTNETRIVNGGSPASDSYTYDLAGNRKVKNSTTCNYNANDQLTNEVVAGNTTVSYLYDANGSLTNKTVTSGSSYAYTYDVQNRLASVSVDGGPATSFVYDYSGIRVRAGNRYYLVDPLNPTGYAQVLEEGTVSGSTFTLSRSYVLGDDVLAQVSGTTPQYLLYDGHGSTRQLSQTTSTGGTHVVEHYNYDAYGIGIGLPTSPAASMLYAGEQWDSVLQQYYLRARYYDPSNGRFGQRDTFEGNNFDPQSLHKYAYAANDPVNRVDPSGEESLTGLLVAAAIVVVLVAIIAPVLVARLSPSGGGWSDRTPQLPSRSSPYLTANWHSVEIDTPLSAGEIFGRLTELHVNEDISKPYGTLPVTGVGQEIGWDMGGLLQEMGQGDFFVRSTKFSNSGDAGHFFSVVTLGRHPLRGWRFWRAFSLPSGHIVAETGAVDEPNGAVGRYKASQGIAFGWLSGDDAIQQMWKWQMEDVLRFSGGTRVQGTPWDNVEGKMHDKSKIDEFWNLVQ